MPSSAPAGTTTGAEPAGGWTFTGAGSTGVTVKAPTFKDTATGTGAASFPLSFVNADGNVTFTETQKPGFTLQQVGPANNLKNAVCTRVDTGAAVDVTNSGALGFTVLAASTYPVSCTVYNRAPTPTSSVALNKRWVINGTSYVDGAQPSTFVASGLINGTQQGWGVPRTGFSQGDAVSLDESAVTFPPQCTRVSSRLTSANGTTVDAALPSSQSLAAGANTYTITNTITCETKLTLVKQVQGGAADPTSWTLDAVAPLGALAGPNGATGSAGATGVAVSPGVTYPLAESGGNPNYAQTVATGANLIPGSTGSWNCVEVRADGTVIPGFSDGLNGGVTVPLGSWVRCTAVNQVSTLVLRKVVVNDNGGTAVPSDWTLTATPVNPPAGVTAQSVTGSAVGNPISVRPGLTYNLTESGPGGYTRTSLVCSVGGGQSQPATSVQIPALSTGVCTFTNDDQAAHLTLVKSVTNDNGGSRPRRSTGR